MLLFVPILLMLTVFPLRVYAEAAVIYIDPPVIAGLSIGETFSVNVTVANVTDLYAWSFQLCYRSDVLNASRWSWGPIFKPHDIINITAVWTDNFNETHGLIQIDCTFFGTVPTFYGTTALVTVYFKVKSFGFALLHLQDTMLLDDSVPFPQEMPHSTADGMVRLGLADVAVTKIALSKNVVNDTVVQINVTVANYGSGSATFNVTLYYDLIEISTRMVKDLAPSNVAEIGFAWDTTPVPKGNYTVSARAHPLLGEANTDDNTLIGGWIMETILGDINGDGKVNILDISAVARAFGAKPGDANWSSNADIDNNLVINILDISKVAREFGKTV